MTPPVWERSVTVDDAGLAWAAGVRTDFIYVLFRHGYPIEEIGSTLLDGFITDTEVIEDAIRYEMSRHVRRKSSPKRSTAK